MIASCPNKNPRDGSYREEIVIVQEEIDLGLTAVSSWTLNYDSDDSIICRSSIPSQKTEF